MSRKKQNKYNNFRGLCVTSSVSDKLHKQTRELMKELNHTENYSFRNRRVKNNGEY